MKTNRREFIMKLFGPSVLTTGMILGARKPAKACMYGTWIVRCPKGHDDKVEGGTCNHTCEKCGEKAFTNGAGYIVCPVGHANYVNTGTSHRREDVLQSYKCRTCNRECRRD